MTVMRADADPDVDATDDAAAAVLAVDGIDAAGPGGLKGWV